MIFCMFLLGLIWGLYYHCYLMLFVVRMIIETFFTMEVKTEGQRGHGLPEIRQPWAQTQTSWETSVMPLA